MQIQQTQQDCQLPCVHGMAEGRVSAPPMTLARRIKLFIRRRLSPAQERILKMHSGRLMNWMAGIQGKPTRPAILAERVASFKAGDLSRVRSLEEIEATLNQWHQLKGCTFMPEMAEYCGTEQRILKPMQRFVDERDLRVKRSRGIVLLEGVCCQGTADFGPCDRSCHFFWREEWLEKVD
jgi:hypothetical protein